MNNLTTDELRSLATTELDERKAYYDYIKNLCDYDLLDAYVINDFDGIHREFEAKRVVIYEAITTRKREKARRIRDNPSQNLPRKKRPPTFGPSRRP